MPVLTNNTTSESVESERTSEMIEFRCTRCWQSNFAGCDLSGNTIACRNCGHETTVPEATPERIARAQALLQEGIATINPYAPPLASGTYSDQQTVALTEETTSVPLREINFSGYSLASIWSRFFAQLIDAALFSMTVFAGVLIVLLMVKQGYISKYGSMMKNEFIGQDGPDLKSLAIIPMVFGLPVLYVFTQWALLATHGQTIGKKLLMIRVVTMKGRLPGFIRGVFLRNWLRVALSFIPLFALFDLLFGLGASRRCIHDLISGTRVVETN